MLEGNRIGILLLHCELHFFALITAQGLLYEARQQQTPNKLLHHCIEQTGCTPKRLKKKTGYIHPYHQWNMRRHLKLRPSPRPFPWPRRTQKICVHSPTHQLNIRRRLKQDPVRQPPRKICEPSPLYEK